MIVGNDEKPGTDAQGKPVINPTGQDTVLIVDLAKPEAPKIVATLQLENSIVGPPVNLAISPNGSIALVADSMTVAEENGVRKLVPTDKVFVIDMQANPPKLVADGDRGQAAFGPIIQPQGRHGAGGQPRRRHHQHSENRRHQCDADRHHRDQPRRPHVVFTPDGKHALALKSPDNKVAVLDVDGDKVTYNKLDIPTYAFPYNIVVTPEFETGDHRGQRQWRFIRRQCRRGERHRPGGRASARHRSRHGGRCARGPRR